MGNVKNTIQSNYDLSVIGGNPISGDIYVDSTVPLFNSGKGSNSYSCILRVVNLYKDIIFFSMSRGDIHDVSL